MKVLENIYYAGNENNLQALDVYLPDSESFPVLVYFHGGGIVKGDKTERRAFLEAMAKNGVAIISANYRLYPDARFPEFIEDAAMAVNWAKEHMKEYGKVEGFFIGGTSAGAYFTQMLCFNKEYLAKYGIDSDEVTGYVMNAGQPTTHFNVLSERGIDSKKIVIDDAAPLYYLTADRTYPPMQIYIAENDILGRFEQTQFMMNSLKYMGHDMDKVDYRYIEGYAHCKYVDVLDEEGRCTFADMVCQFIKKYN